MCGALLGGGSTYGARLACLPLLLERGDVDVPERLAVLVEDAVAWVGGGFCAERRASTYGSWEKSRSYASSIAREIASSDGSANAGGSCRSYTPAIREVNVPYSARAQCSDIRDRRTSTTAPRYLSPAPKAGYARPFGRLEDVATAAADMSEVSK